MTNQDAFIAGWNALERAERKQLRRLVRLGRPVDDAKLDALATGYAQYQSTRFWMRFFWLWFVPGVFFTLSIAMQMHPIVIGVVLAFAVQAVLTYRNIRKRAALSALAV